MISSTVIPCDDVGWCNDIVAEQQHEWKAARATSVANVQYCTFGRLVEHATGGRTVSNAANAGVSPTE